MSSVCECANRTHIEWQDCASDDIFQDLSPIGKPETINSPHWMHLHWTRMHSTHPLEDGNKKSRIENPIIWDQLISTYLPEAMEVVARTNICKSKAICSCGVASSITATQFPKYYLHWFLSTQSTSNRFVSCVFAQMCERENGVNLHTNKLISLDVRNERWANVRWRPHRLDGER